MIKPALFLLIVCCHTYTAFAQWLDSDNDPHFFILSSTFADDDLKPYAENDTLTYDKKNPDKPKIVPPPFTVQAQKKKRIRMCNNDTLQKIMKENIQDNPKTSKRAIYHAAFEVLSVELNVICARCPFSFLTKTSLYCQENVKDIACFAYKDD